MTVIPTAPSALRASVTVDARALRCSPLTAATMATVTTCLWLTQHAYWGLLHDSQLYAFQALSRLHPELLSGDIFLRYGSQDDFTLFSPLYAAAIHALGVEPAAAMLTLIFHAGFFVAAWFLARMLMPPILAWFGLALLAALPSEYSAYGTFRYLEDFLTPRLAAEALVLAGLAAQLARRHFWALACVLIAGVLHPLMTAAGVAVGLLIEAHERRIRMQWAAALIVAGGLILPLVAPTGYPLRFDETWFELIQSRTPFLHVVNWRLEDWAKMCCPLLALLMSAALLPQSGARTLGAATLIAALCGIALTAIGADLLRLVLVTQIQPWRWLWLAGAVSVLLIGPLALRCWQLGAIARAAFMLLLSTWLCRDELYVFAVAALAGFVILIVARKWAVPTRHERLIHHGSLALLAICLIINLTNGVMSASIVADSGMALLSLRGVRALAQDGVIPALLLTGIWFFALRKSPPVPLAIVGGASLLAVLLLLPSSVAAWSNEEYDQRARDPFAEWRALIPPRTEVLWADGLSPTWLLLQRPGYLTNGHVANALFSREAALQLKRRASALAPFLKNEHFVPWPDDERAARAWHGTLTLDAICAGSDVKFLVTRQNLHAEAIGVLEPSVALRYRGLKLYRCDP